MGTNCALLLADLFLYSYEAEFVHSLLKAVKKYFAQQFNFTYRYIDDVLALKTTNLKNIWNFSIHVSLKERKQRRLQPPPHIWIALYIDNGKLTTSLYDKQDDFNNCGMTAPEVRARIVVT